MAQAFSSASQLRRVREGQFLAEIPDGWQQGRGAFGGLALGLLARACQQRVAGPDGQPTMLRTLTGSICAPVLPGPSTIDVELLRAGRRLTFVRATLRQPVAGADAGDDSLEIKATATCTLGGSRPVASRRIAPAAPDLGNFEDAAVVPMRAPMGPVFAQHYEYRSTGPFPFSGASEARAEGWIRTREDPHIIDAPAIVGLLDAYWPAEFALEKQMRPMATVSFTAEFFVDPATLSGDAPFAYRARTEAAAQGFAAEFRELWRDGELVAMNQQTFVAIA